MPRSSYSGGILNFKSFGGGSGVGNRSRNSLATGTSLSSKPNPKQQFQMEPRMNLNYIMEPNAKSFSVIGAPVTDKDQIFP